MENPVEPQKSKTGIIVVIIISILVAMVCAVAVIVIAAITIMGPLVGKVYSTINSSLSSPTEIDDFPSLPVKPTPEIIFATPETLSFSAPPMTIDVSKQYFATFKMAKGGQFVVQLYPDKAPITVNSFAFLARKGFFNGVTFHRVLDGFMAQGGDPTGTGAGGPGYEFVNENSDLIFDKAGVIAMANAGPNTNGSQFFITFGPAEFLNGSYTIFGQVIEGMGVVNAITRRDPEQNPSFTGDVMESVTISEK